jgi:succinate-semialdehyde dehydrogenase / glutarate-semialdehyde dehydrogenase
LLRRLMGMSETSIPNLLAHLPASSDQVTIVNPSTGKKIYDLPQLSVAQVAKAVADARLAQPAWAKVSVKERAQILYRLHDLILKNQDNIMDLLQLETGKSRAHAFEEIAGSLGAARYNAKIAPKTLKTQKTFSGVPLVTQSYVMYSPVGVVGVITPWNYPLALQMMDSLPALVAGNVIVQKADNQTALVSLYARQLAIEAGIPDSAWTIVVGDGASVGNAITDSVDFVAFTGSTNTGRVVAERAAKRLIGFSLELGGKNPMIVLPGSKVGDAAEKAIAGAFGNSGQLCVSIERVYVPNTMKAAFEKELAERVTSMTVGKSNDFAMDMGTLTGINQLTRVQDYVSDAVGKGAKVLAGAKALPELGPYFYAPTVLTDITDDMRLSRQEVFGPLIAVVGYDSIDQAVELANDTEFGLNASIVGPTKLAKQVAGRIMAGSVNVNEGYRAAMASVDSPMGGMKQSGVGRRNGKYGILRFTEARTVGVSTGLLKFPSRARQYKMMAPLMNALAKVMKKL